jgi:DNA-binding LacI/PurR family transcriptional regulator
MSVVGFNDTPLMDKLHPRFITVHVPMYVPGRPAVYVSLDQIALNNGYIQANDAADNPEATPIHRDHPPH